mmetsp:Transcript_7565/g.17792  ORF Transcript_7565/g.17792 Transcript_7565/m.17792 type:complete len:383 (-) Transcript_7565:273-1421(-)
MAHRALAVLLWRDCDVEVRAVPRRLCDPWRLDADAVHDDLWRVSGQLGRVNRHAGVHGVLLPAGVCARAKLPSRCHRRGLYRGPRREFATPDGARTAARHREQHPRARQGNALWLAQPLPSRPVDRHVARQILCRVPGTGADEAISESGRDREVSGALPQVPFFGAGEVFAAREGDDESVGVAGAGDRDARRQVGWLQGANVERVRGREHPARPAAAQAQGGRQTRRVGVGSAVAARASRPHNGPGGPRPRRDAGGCCAAPRGGCGAAARQHRPERRSAASCRGRDRGCGERERDLGRAWRVCKSSVFGRVSADAEYAEPDCAEQRGPRERAASGRGGGAGAVLDAARVGESGPAGAANGGARDARRRARSELRVQNGPAPP